ncbi:MAG: aminotransferase class I/II-fold pyridoxal phosphate-dependent enzyme [Actinomycetota bacterium]|nr:aminotransferase class I/II-fold pyridoxal phosphate-dependent enzyme [Actinomycetota bacterium]
MPRSGIRELVELAATVTDVIHLEIGEPSFKTPAAIVEAGVAAARGQFTRYSPSSGFPSLREQIAQRLSTERACAIDPRQVIVTPGASFGLAASILALVDPGDEVLVPDPGWPNYVTMTLLAGATPVPYPLLRHEAFLPDPGSLQACITNRTKVLIVNTPANPTGAVYPRQLFERIYQLAADHDLYLISDEVYEAFVFEGAHEPPSQFDSDGRVVTISGYSKSYAMTGWRVGYAIAAPPVATAVGHVVESMVLSASAISQKAAETACSLPPEVIAEMRDAYRARARVVVDLLGDAGLLASVPKGAFYALVDVSGTGRSSHQVARDLLRMERVATVPGAAFGRNGEGMVRISLAAEEESLREGCVRIRRHVLAGRS